MKAKKRRNADVALYPQTHLKGVLRMRAKKRPARAFKKGFIGTLRTIGLAVFFPFAKGIELIRRGKKSTRERLHGEQDTLRPQSLPYYQPQMNIVGLADGQAVLSMERTSATAEDVRPSRMESRNNEKARRQRADSAKAFSCLAAGAATEGSAAVRMEQVLGPDCTLPEKRTLSKEDAGLKRSRAQERAKAGRSVVGNATIRWHRLAAILAGAALMGFSGWYMLEGRYREVSVFDDGYLHSVRTKESTIREMLEVAQFGLTPEDSVSVALEEKPQKGMVVSIARARNIGITVDDGQSASLRLSEGTVGDALAQAGITVAPNDDIIPSLDTIIRTDLDVLVYRAKALSIKTKSKTINVSLGTGTVGDALLKAGIAYDSRDRIEPSPDTAISDGMEISYMAVEIKQVTRKEVIEYDTVKKNSDEYYYGTTKVSQSGKNGERAIVEEVTYRDGVEVSRKKISSKVTKEPVDKIILIGCKPTLNPAIAGLPKGGPTDDMIVEAVTMVQVTAYTHTGNRTASGKWPKVGMCAIDRDAFSFGTLFYVPGYGYAVAEDTGSGIGDPYSMDLFMDTKEECIRWGRKRNKVVYVLRWP